MAKSKEQAGWGEFFSGVLIIALGFLAVDSLVD